MSQTNDVREHVITTYQARARHYDITARLYALLGLPQQSYRRKAVQALRLHPGDTVVEIGCGTGLNFSLVQQAIGPEGRIIGVDLTDAMLSQARRRIAARGWKNVTLVQADAADYRFPAGVNGILSTFALSLVPECAEVIAHGCAALAPCGRWVVLDCSLPRDVPRWLERGYLALVRPFAVTDEWAARRPWETVRTAMRGHLSDFSSTDLFFGCLYLAAGTHEPDDHGPARSA